MNGMAIRTRLVMGLTTLAVVAFSTPTPVLAVCGDGVIDVDEDCDPGGTCIGGANAGTHCTAGAACTGGTCTTFGGTGCAANCTFEHDVPYPLIPGQLDGLSLLPATSGVAIASDFLSIPLPLGSACSGGANADLSCTTAADCGGEPCVPAQETLTIGKERAGKIPLVVKAASVRFPSIPVSTLLPGCIVGVAGKTCGGTFLESDGVTPSLDCTPNYTAGEGVCAAAGKPPCTFVHGAGNSASGEIGCDGLDNINVNFSQDSGGASGVARPAMVTFSGSGGPGSALVLNTVGVRFGGEYGPDGIHCTADDPVDGLFVVAVTSPAVTGTATAQVLNANGTDGVNLPPNGPVSATGAPFSCAALARDSAAGAGLVQAFPRVHLDTVGDAVVTAQLFVSLCGNGLLEPGEECDDANTWSGDGCSSACQIEPCFTCSGQPSTCTLASAGTTCPSIGSCSVGACDGAGTCVQMAASDGTPCDDGLFCNGTDTCHNGTCVHSGDPCVGGPECANVCNRFLRRCIAPAGTQCSGLDPNPCMNACILGTCVPGMPVTQSPCCGNGILLFGEQCDDGNQDPGDGCDARCIREVGWSCPVPGQPCQHESHFQCYTGITLAGQPPATVTLADALTSFTARVRGLRDLCNPTNKNGEDPLAAALPDHLESYAIVPEKPKLLRHVLPLRNQKIQNQFGVQQLNLLWPNRLLVPTAKSLTASPPAPVSPAIDHFTCYRVKRARGWPAFAPIANVTVADQFGPATVIVGRPTRLCMAANKNNEDPGAETHNGRFLCYHLTGGFKPIGRVFTNNQFGPGIFYPRARHELCVPSVMDP